MELLTVDDAAAILKLSPYTVREFLKAGKLPGHKTGGGKEWRIRKEDLQAYVRKQRRLAVITTIQREAAEERAREYAEEEAQARAEEEAEERAETDAKEAATEVAKEAYDEAYEERYKEVFDEVYAETYSEAYNKAYSEVYEEALADELGQ